MNLTEQATFTKVLTRLAATLNEPLAEDRIEGYLGALADLDLRWLQISAGDFGKSATYLPKPNEWRTRAHQAEREALQVAVAPARAEPWHDECADCHDTGWVDRHCPEQSCNRPRCLYPHAFVTICSCRPTNRTYRRNHQAGAA
jgi:hypothetical protein